MMGKNAQALPIGSAGLSVLGVDGLNPTQAAFLDAYLQNGFDAIDAARTAGSTDPGQYARTVFRSPKVQAALQAATRGDLAGLAGEAVAGLASILRNPDTSAASLRLKLDAAKTILDRVGVVHAAGNEGRKAGALEDIGDEELREILAKFRAGEGPAVVDITPS